MEYVTLGKTGLRVSRMGLGGIPIQKIDAEEQRHCCISWQTGE